MKRNLFWLVLTLLLVVSCSNGDEPLIPCITVSDCPDSSYSCFDGFCVHAGAVVDPTGSDSDTSSGETLPDGGQNEGGNTNDNDNENDSDLPEPVTVDSDENSEPSSDKDSAEISDKDNGETSDKDDEFSDEDGTQTSDGDSVEENDSETTDNGGNENADKENISDADSNEEVNDAETSDENATGNDADNENNDGEGCDDSDNAGDTDGDSSSVSDDDTESVDDSDIDVVDPDNDIDADLDNDADHDVEIPAEPAACATAIAALPHGGKYDWEDGTTQGFSNDGTYLYPYWNVVPETSLPAEYQPPLIQSGNYSFGKYTTVNSEKYKANTNQTSALPAADLSQCSQCTVKAKFYVRGANWISSCDTNNHDYLNPTCKGSSDSSWIEATFDDGKSFLSKACSYSKEKWTELEWTIPDTCKTEEFFFGFRFKSDVSVEGPGLVVDNLTIYTTTKNEPKGEFESAEDGKITGWACDPDAYSEKVPVKVRYYKNNDESVIAAERSVDAESERTDLTQCGGTYNHGFEIPLDMELAGILGIGTHSAAVFIGDLPANCSGSYKLIGIKEFEITALDPKQQ